MQFARPGSAEARSPSLRCALWLRVAARIGALEGPYSNVSRFAL